MDNMMVAVGRAPADKFERWRISNEQINSAPAVSSCCHQALHSPLCRAAAAAVTASAEAPDAAGLVKRPEA